jgi:hypothetical protein
MCPGSKIAARHRLPWYAWPLAPVAFAAACIIMLPLSLLALLSIPYFALYPDYHVHIYDVQGTGRQRELLARWRACYARLGLFARCRRAITLLGRRGIKTPRCKRRANVGGES